MRLFLIIIYSFTLIIKQSWTSNITQELKLVVNPAGFMMGAGPPVLIKKVDDSLNLTCRLQNENQETLQNYNISWNWQYSTGSNANRVMMVSLSHNEANLVFVSLKETDSGEYTCRCSELNLTEHVRLKVKSMSLRKNCSEKMFSCAPGQCISKHYVCDGRKDCKDGIDELNCGMNPCEGKIPCEDGRCIPTAWCCDELHDPNCTVKRSFRPKCCQQLLKSYQDPDHIYSEQHFSDMGFLQTTIYTVIGCAMAFMFIVTILVIAICRVHIKRTIVSRCPLNHQHLRPGSPLRPPLPLYDIDMFLDRHTDSTNHPGLLVTYNINNGVQFVGRPIDPPPYCEVIDTPPREGPPPPYVSRENVNLDSSEVQTPTQETEVESESTSGINENEEGCSSNTEIKNDDVCSSPSVSGLNNNSEANSNKRCVFNDFSDSESDSMESDALLSEAILQQKESDKNDDPKVIRSSSLNANISSSPPNSFINNITAVSKTFIGSLKRNDERSKLNRQLITQKSFDSSEPCDLKVNDNTNFNKVTHSVGDLSPVNADLDRIDFLTLPLRESFIGVRNEEV